MPIPLAIAGGRVSEQDDGQPPGTNTAQQLFRPDDRNVLMCNELYLTLETAAPGNAVSALHYEKTSV